MKSYKPIITLTKNDRGIWDLDTSKGCASGMLETKNGCYGECYAAKAARIYRFDFSTTVLRYFKDYRHERQIVKKINTIDMPFVRIGCSGDPSENWRHTFSIIDKIKKCNKEIVIITKHWTIITDEFLDKLSSYKICINTSVSALDNTDRLNKCLCQYERLKPYCKSVLRIVSCDFNKENETGLKMSLLQDSLFKNELTLDTVFRVSKNNKLVSEGVINIKESKFLGHKSLISKFNRKTYFGKCDSCIEKCGVFDEKIRSIPVLVQQKLF